MEKPAVTEHIIRNIISEVVRECKNHRIRALPGFISYYVNLIQLDPARALTLDCITNREKVQRFVKYVVWMLGNKNDPKMITLRLQHEFRSYIIELDKVVQQYRRRLSNKLYPLLLDIIEQDRRNTDEQLYKKMCYYITLASGLGNPTARPVFKETLQVLKSIMDPEEIKVFPSLQNYIKQELLGTLVDIITGIRLYNKACKKGGEGMADLPGLLEKAILVVEDALNDCMEQSSLRATLLTRSAEKHMHIIKGKTGDWDISVNFNTSAEQEKWEFIRDLAAAHRQLCKTTRILLDSVKELERHRKLLHEGFNETIQMLNKIVVPTLYQAVTNVFPHFAHLANIWKEYQDDSVRLKEIADIFKIQANQIFNLVFDVSIETQPSDFEKWMDWQDEPLITKVYTPYVKVHTVTKDFTRKDLEFNGYCSWVLVSTGGLLLPADVSLGVIEYRKLLYGFSSNMAANCFIRNPDKYVMNTLDLARKRVYLVKLLNLESRLKQIVQVKVLIKKKAERKIAVASQEVQTDDHMQKSHLNCRYGWNLWEYKRAALRRTDLKTKITTSCETDKTYQKESNCAQTNEMADAGTQTKSDNYGNTLKPLRFIYGLRGYREKYPFVLDLKEPLSCSQGPKKDLNGNKN